METKMTVVKSPRLDQEEAEKNGEKPLPLNELLALIKTKGTVQEREQVASRGMRYDPLFCYMGERGKSINLGAEALRCTERHILLVFYRVVSVHAMSRDQIEP